MIFMPTMGSCAPPSSRQGGAPKSLLDFSHSRDRRSLDLAVSPELLEIGPRVGSSSCVADRYDHFRSGNLRARIGHEVLERRFAPRDVGALYGGAVVVTGDAARLTPLEPIENGAELVRRSFADCMTDAAECKPCLACGNILRMRCRSECGKRYN